MKNQTITRWGASISALIMLSVLLAASNDAQRPPAAAAPEPDSAAADPEAGRRSSPEAERVRSTTRGVLGGKHDFSALTGRVGDACSACHVPHIQAAEPREGDEEPFSLAFYRIAGQREVLEPDRYMPGPTSLICLSCHNGTVASSVVGTAHALLAGEREGFDVEGFAMRDHPIGIEYPIRKEGYKPRSVVVSLRNIPLPDGRMECTSCHDPHNERGLEKMLVMSNRRSALCLACHEK
jgi:predicted CXXCH cytochrome family protein